MAQEKVIEKVAPAEVKLAKKEKKVAAEKTNARATGVRTGGAR
jgi:hypothetical protein